MPRNDGTPYLELQATDGSHTFRLLQRFRVSS